MSVCQIQPEFPIMRIGTCGSCRQQPCVHPTIRQKRPDNGCNDWTSGLPDPDWHLRASDEDMPKLNRKQQRRLDALTSAKIKDCKALLQAETDITVVQHLHRIAHDEWQYSTAIQPTIRETIASRRLNQLNKVKA